MKDWEILDLYFKDHKYPFTGHHLDSYRNFVKVKSHEAIFLKLDKQLNNVMKCMTT